ncbi:MAG: DUF559 domain-containing protein [Caldilineaceae bacterium]
MRNTKKYKSLPYNPALARRAKALRKAGILHEALLWLQLKSKKLNGLDFDRQKIIGNYIVDFYCAEKDVVIEVDGSSHDSKQPADAERTSVFELLGANGNSSIRAGCVAEYGRRCWVFTRSPRFGTTPPSGHPSRGGE